MLNDPNFVQIFVQVRRCYSPVPGKLGQVTIQFMQFQFDKSGINHRRCLLNRPLQPAVYANNNFALLKRAGNRDTALPSARETAAVPFQNGNK